MRSNTFPSWLRRTAPGSRLLSVIACGMLLAASLAAGQTFTVLYSFQGPPDAQAPELSFWIARVSSTAPPAAVRPCMAARSS